MLVKEQQQFFETAQAGGEPGIFCFFSFIFSCKQRLRSLSYFAPLQSYRSNFCLGRFELQLSDVFGSSPCPECEELKLKCFLFELTLTSCLNFRLSLSQMNQACIAGSKQVPSSTPPPRLKPRDALTICLFENLCRLGITLFNAPLASLLLLNQLTLVKP